MINKRSIWFLTLFSLILVLSVYYITMPSELLLNTNGNYMNTSKILENNAKENFKAIILLILIFMFSFCISMFLIANGII